MAAVRFGTLQVCGQGGALGFEVDDGPTVGGAASASLMARSTSLASLVSRVVSLRLMAARSRGFPWGAAAARMAAAMWRAVSGEARSAKI